MNYYSLIPSAPSYNPAAFSSCCRISSANHCGCRLFSGGFADIDEPYNPSKVEMTPLWRLFDRHRFSLWQRNRRRSGRGARSSLSRLASIQAGMSAGRNLIEWKSRRGDSPEVAGTKPFWRSFSGGRRAWPLWLYWQHVRPTSMIVQNRWTALHECSYFLNKT